MDKVIIVTIIVLLYVTTGITCYMLGKMDYRAQLEELLEQMKQKKRPVRTRLDKLDMGNLLDPVTPAEQRLELALERKRKRIPKEEDDD